MSTLLIVLGIFVALSFLTSIVVVSASALSSQISQEYEESELTVSVVSSRSESKDKELRRERVHA